MVTFAEFYKIFETIRHIFGILLNSLLIYCVLRRSPANIARYSFFLLNCALSDLLTCLFSLYVEPRLIRYLDGVYYICYGFCKYSGYQSCIFGYAIILMLYGHLNTSQLASFIYRWFILRFNSPSKKQIFFLISILTMPNVVLFITCSIPLVLNNISEDYREMVLRLHPEEADASMATFGVPLAFVDLRGQLPSFYLLFSVVPITFAVFVIRWRILSFLKGRQTLFSEQSKTMQQALLRALTFQAFLPSLHLFGSLISIPIISDNIKEFPLHFEKEFYEYSLFFFCGFVPIIAPICSLYFVSPYRRFVGSLFAKQKPEISPIAVSTLL